MTETTETTATPAKLLNDWHNRGASTIVGSKYAIQQKIVNEILTERGKQDDKWGEQNHSDGTGAHLLLDYVSFGPEMNMGLASRVFRQRTDRLAEEGLVTWRDIILEEMFETAAESNPETLRAELVQTLAVGVAWLEAIDRRKNAPAE